MDPHAIDARVRYAKALAASSIIPDAYRGQPANVLVAIETGAALGIPAPQALGGLAVIKGKPTMTADLMSAVVRRAGHRLRVTEHDGAVTASLVRSDDPEFTYKVTWDRAKAERAGLWGTRGPWVSYPGQMLRSRAVAEVCRQGASDALMGVIYSPEEMGAPVDEEGAVIDSGPSTTTAAPLFAGTIPSLIQRDLLVRVGRPDCDHLLQLLPVQILKRYGTHDACEFSFVAPFTIVLTIDPIDLFSTKR